MLFRENTKLPDGRFLLSAGCAWLIGAALLLTVGTFAANAAGMGERGLGYLSSGISFLAAVAAGSAAVRKNPAARLLTALIAATALVIALLTIGLLAEGEEMNASAVLSIVSFTYAGVLLGAVMAPGKKRYGKKNHFSKLT